MAVEFNTSAVHTIIRTALWVGFPKVLNCSTWCELAVLHSLSQKILSTQECVLKLRCSITVSFGGCGKKSKATSTSCFKMKVFAKGYQTEHPLLCCFLSLVAPGVSDDTFWSHFAGIIKIALRRLFEDRPLTLLFSLVLLHLLEWCNSVSVVQTPVL